MPLWDSPSDLFVSGFCRWHCRNGPIRDDACALGVSGNVIASFVDRVQRPDTLPSPDCATAGKPPVEANPGRGMAATLERQDFNPVGSTWAELSYGNGKRNE
jgi:hypothetical protein